jgi:uncharacterized protein (UPF0332 family)
MGYSPDKAILIKEYLKMAEERLESARALADIGNFSDSISRSYYAFLDAASAALISVNIAPQSHAGAIGLFGKHFVKTKEVPDKFGKMFKRIEKSRLEADYKHLKSLPETKLRMLSKKSASSWTLSKNYLTSKKIAAGLRVVSIILDISKV